MAINKQPRRVLFISTRIHGTDGVSLEIEKWTTILERLGYECFFLSGQSDRPQSHSQIVALADFLHPVIQEINAACFGTTARSQQMTSLIEDTARKIKEQVYDRIQQIAPSVVVVENALTLPMNLPLGIALDQVLMETQIPCILHHHDFAWERERFLVNSVSDLISAHFPPRRPQPAHVVINSLARENLSRRAGLSSWVIPNVMDFANPPPSNPEAASELRQSLGIASDELFLLQPTRVVARKGIEHSIELARSLADLRCKLVISHATDDEGPQYAQHIRRFADYMDVPLIFAGDQIMAGRSGRSNHRFTVGNAYEAADMVTFPSTYEGFGNAFLEAIYFKRPIFCNRYTIFQTEIEPIGFDVPMMSGFLDQRTIDSIRDLLKNPQRRELAGERNYQLARTHFSYERAELQIRHLLDQLDTAHWTAL